MSENGLSMLRKNLTWLQATALRARQSKFVHGASSLMLYTIAGQGITVLSALALARIYSPDEFGLYGIVFSYTAIIGNIVCLNYDLGVPAPKSDDEAAALTLGAATISLLSSFLLSLAFLFLVATDRMSLGSLPSWAWLLVWVMLITSGISTLLQYWVVRQQNLRLIGKASLLQNTIRAGAQMGFGGVLSGHWLGLALGEIIGRLVLTARFLRANWHDLYSHKGFTTLPNVLQTLARYRRFPLVLLPPMVLDSVLASVSVLLINSMFGLTIAGQYWLMRRVIDLPVSFIAKTVGDAFHGKISEYARTDPAQVRRLLVRLFVILLSLSAIAFAPLIAFGPSIFSVVFGAPWKMAGLLAAVTVPAMVMNIATGPVTRVFAISHRLRLRYIFTAVTFLGYLIVFGATWHYDMNILWTAAGLSLLYFISYSVYFVTAYIAAGYVTTEQLKELA